MHTHVTGPQPSRLDADLTTANAPRVSSDLPSILESASRGEGLAEWPGWINAGHHDFVAAK